MPGGVVRFMVFSPRFVIPSGVISSVGMAVKVVDRYHIEMMDRTAEVAFGGRAA
jgi:hypothetical protein